MRVRPYVAYPLAREKEGTARDRRSCCGDPCAHIGRRARRPEVIGIGHFRSCGEIDVTELKKPLGTSFAWGYARVDPPR
jgi:hypothetical protein